MKTKTNQAESSTVKDACKWNVAAIGSNLYIQSGPDTDIALVYRPYPSEGEDGSPEAMEKRRLKNAELIASAPNMLGEIFRLRQALLMYHEAWNGCEGNWHEAMREASRTANEVLYPE